MHASVFSLESDGAALGRQGRATTTMEHQALSVSQRLMRTSRTGVSHRLLASLKGVSVIWVLCSSAAFDAPMADQVVVTDEQAKLARSRELRRARNQRYREKLKLKYVLIQ